MSHERPPISNEWYTPQYIFDALGCTFDLDVCGNFTNEFQCVPAKRCISHDSIIKAWRGFLWMNPPFGGRNGIIPWLDKFIDHGNGICLTPDRTSAPWWQHIAENSNGVVFVSPKVRFIDHKGNKGASPSVGTTLFSIGNLGRRALMNSGLGFYATNNS